MKKLFVAGMMTVLIWMPASGVFAFGGTTLKSITDTVEAPINTLGNVYETAIQSGTAPVKVDISPSSKGGEVKLELAPSGTIQLKTNIGLDTQFDPTESSMTENITLKIGDTSVKVDGNLNLSTENQPLDGGLGITINDQTITLGNTDSNGGGGLLPGWGDDPAEDDDSGGLPGSDPAEGGQSPGDRDPGKDTDRSSNPVSEGQNPNEESQTGSPTPEKSSGHDEGNPGETGMSEDGAGTSALVSPAKKGNNSGNDGQGRDRANGRQGHDQANGGQGSKDGTVVKKAKAGTAEGININKIVEVDKFIDKWSASIVGIIIILLAILFYMRKQEGMDREYI